MSPLHQVGSAALLVLATFPLADFGPSCSERCGADACTDQIEIDAAVPPMSSTSWTVTVCRNGDCVSETLTPQATSSVSGTTSVRLDTSGASPELVVVAHPDAPKNGDVWSLKVVDAQGKTIASGQQSVMYTPYSNSPACPTCQKATVSV
jgi:hypothetical protein